MKKLFKELQQEGWEITKGGSGHLKLRHPIYGLVVCSSSPSCPFVELKIKADIRRKIKQYQGDQHGQKKTS